MTGTAATGAATPTPVTPVCRRIEGTTPAGMEVTPAAHKPRVHELAVEPDSIERELSMSEVTYSLWQLKKQQQNDHQWFLQATASLSNHAQTLDRQAVSIMKLRADTAEAVSQTQAAVAQVCASHDQHQAAIELFEQAAEMHHQKLDVDLRKHVIEEVTNRNKKIDDTVAATNAAAAAGTTTALELRLQHLTHEVQRLDQQAGVSMVEVVKIIQAEKTEARVAFAAIKTEVGGIIGRITALETAQPKAPSPPGFGAEFGADFSGKGPGRASAGDNTQQRQQQPTTTTTGPTFFHMADPAGAEGSTGRPKTLYDEKVAQTPANQYNDQHPEKLVEWTRGYLIGRRREMENVLKWGEKWAKTTIPEDKVVELRQSFCHGDGFDPVQADRDLWSFLNLNVTGTKIEGKFRTVKRLRWFEAWRVIVSPIEPKTLTKLRELHRLVHHPAQCKKLSEIEQAIIDWEKNRDDYYACGGQTVEEAEQCTIILDLMPADTPSTLMMALEDYEGDFTELKKKIDKQITFLTDHAKSHSGRINIADERTPLGSSRCTASVAGDEEDSEEQSHDHPAGAVDLTTFPEICTGLDLCPDACQRGQAASTNEPSASTRREHPEAAESQDSSGRQWRKEVAVRELWQRDPRDP